jgi:hypothetical protein
MIEFKYDENGVLMSYENGKLIGPILTMGDDLLDKGEENKKEDKNGERNIHQPPRRDK